jgi:ketosteroid isomerase-like protein
MRGMKIAAPLCAAALASCALPLSNEAAVSLAQAETQFAAHSVREDMRAAFLAHFAPDGVTVRDGWIVSNEFMRERPAPPIVLDWRPAFTEAAAAGDLGLSTGPVRITSKAKPESAPSYGQYVSIWRREPGGPWRVEVDLGISNAGPALWDEPLQSVATPREARGREARSTLAQAEASFDLASRQHGARAAYAGHGAATLRYYRSESGPLHGRAAAEAAMPGEPIAWFPERIEVSRSGDLGYARGRFALASAPEATLGWYLRAWHVERGEWRIVMDVANPPSGS